MTKPIIGLLLISTFIFSSCTSFLKKDLKLLLNEGDYGWYFVIIENELSNFNQKNDYVDLCNEHFSVIKLGELSDYGDFVIYDCVTQKRISHKVMQKITSGQSANKTSFNFYYPDPNIYPPNAFKTPNVHRQEEVDLYDKVDLELSLERDSLFRNYIEKYNVDWWVRDTSQNK